MRVGQVTEPNGQPPGAAAFPGPDPPRHDPLSAAIRRAGIDPAKFSAVDAGRRLARNRPAFLAALKEEYGVAPLAARQAVANALGSARRSGAIPGLPPPLQAGALPVSAAFVTYGDARYLEQRERIAGHAEESGWFDASHCWRYGRGDAEQLAASSDAAAAVLSLERGGGYWIWKPLVIRDALSRLPDGAVLLYADAGCSLHSTEKANWESKLRGLSEARPIDAHRLHGRTIDGKLVTNGAWCRSDVAHAVLGDCSPAFLAHFFSYDQIEANRILILACDASRDLVGRWAELALTASELFTDAPSSRPNESTFYEHRHDQAIFSALMYRRGWSGSGHESWKCVVATRLRTEALKFWTGFASAERRGVGR